MLNPLKIHFWNESRHKAEQIKHKENLIFANLNKEARFPPKVSFGAIWKYYCNFPKNAKCRGKIPFVDSNFKSIFKNLSFAWLGHSSGFIAFSDIRILIDPIFSMYASPLPFINRAFSGVKCFSANDFGEVFITLITHSHFDHLDKNSIVALKNTSKFFICPLCVGKYLITMGVEKERIIELDWWEGVEFYFQDFTFRLIATPAQHTSSRGDGFNKSLWASFVVEFSFVEQKKRIFWSADGGYYTHFKEIGEFFGGFDIAFLESGQYNKAWRFSHSFPDEIIQEAKDLHTKVVVPIHWARFVAGSHDWNGVVKYLYKEFKALNLPFFTPKIGQIFHIDEQLEQDCWWDKI